MLMLLISYLERIPLTQKASRSNMPSTYKRPFIPDVIEQNRTEKKFIATISFVVYNTNTTQHTDCDT